MQREVISTVLIFYTVVTSPFSVEGEIRFSSAERRVQSRAGLLLHNIVADEEL